MKWYDVFSNIYDASLEKLYHDSRKRAVALLSLEAGEKVLDVACGTGANFKHLKAENHDVTIFGTDFSKGMLRRAKDNIAKNKWDKISLYQSDARLLTPSYITEQWHQEGQFDKVLCVLGLSVIPEWEDVMDKLLGLLKPDGRLVVVDVFAEKRDFNTWMVEKVAKADLDREIWQTLERKTETFYHEYLPVKESKVGGKLFVATGVKK